MNKLFNYESKAMQAMMNLASLMIMNVLYLLCCIPVVTIGAAQAGLYSGVRHMQDEETDTPCLPEFFKGMKAGFKKITLVHTVSLLPLAVIAGSFVLSWLLNQTGKQMPMWASGAGIVLFAAWHTMLVIFHATFECTARELVRNSFRAALAFPIQSVVSGIVLWLPLGLFVMFPSLFLNLLPLWIVLYYSIAYELIFALMKKPLRKMKESMFPEE